MPEAVGLPLIIKESVCHLAITPSGSPDALPIPVAPVVLCVIFVKVVFMQRVGAVDEGETVFAGVTVMVPVALTLSHPPVKGIL